MVVVHRTCDGAEVITPGRNDQRLVIVLGYTFAVGEVGLVLTYVLRGMVGGRGVMYSITIYLPKG